jgi:hypothetical protein
MNSQGQVTKEEADYGKSSSPAQHRCGICEYYRPEVGKTGFQCNLTEGQGACTLVEGSIEPMYGCKLFSIDLALAVNDPINVSDYPPPKEK